MTAVSDIIQAAYREGNLIPVGTQPTTDEQTEALVRLNTLVRGVFGFETGQRLGDWLVPAPQRTAPVAANFPQLPYPMTMDSTMLSAPIAADPLSNVYPFPPQNSRIVFGGPGYETVYFPEAPDDGARMAVVAASGAYAGGDTGATLHLDGNGRTIEGAPTQDYTVPFATREWFYRADLGNWVALVDVALTDDFLFPSELDDFFVCSLAVRLASRYGKTPEPGTISTYQTMRSHFRSRYRQTGTTIFGAQDTPRSLQSYINGIWFY